jgi:1,2-diacylglycerol 3-alpha-glucosyltransferase
MKIAFFTDTYYPQVNGVVKSIDLFYKHLKSLGNEVHIFCPDDSGINKDEHIHLIASSQFKSYPEYRVGLPSSLRIMEEVKNINPDIIHIHSPFTIGLVGMSIAKILKIPIVATYHTLLPEYFSYAGSSNFKKLIDEYTNCFFNRSTIVIVPSKSIKDLLKIKTPIEILPTSSELKITRNNKKRNKKLTILHVGRLCKEKKIDVILNAFAKINKKIDSKLIITSDGPDKERLKKLCKKLKIENEVNFTGYVSDKELIKLYSTSDVFVSASDTETQGIVILEAMINGCPVIARNALGFKDVIKNRKNGILFDSEDELIKDVLLINNNNKLKNKLTKNGYETARKFNISNYVKKIEEVYKESFDNFRNSKTTSKILYASYLFFSSLESWIIKNMRLTINSRFLELHIRLFKMLFPFERFKSV